MSSILEQDVFQIKRLIENIDIKLCARCENGVKQLLALVTSDGEIVLHYTYGELTPLIKRIPWFTESQKQVQAICFDAFATWLLLVCADASLYIIPALNLVDKKQRIDCKWSLNDVTHFPKHSQTPDADPTCCVWWQTLDCNQNALVGFNNGAIVLISLTDGRCLGVCSVPEPVKKLFLCQDKSLETVSLLINGETGQQWRLILEHHSTGYVWPPDMTQQTDDNSRSRLYSLKQLGVDKLASLKQRLAEARGNLRDSQNSDSASESSHSESIQSSQSGPELLPHLCDTYFAPQFAKNRYLFSAFYRPTSLLTVHAVDVESAPIYIHKLTPNTNIVLLTDRFIFTINDDNSVSVISCQLSECRLEGDAEFNNESLVAKFLIRNENILETYKLIDLTTFRLKKHKEDNKSEKFFELPKSVDDLNVQKPRIDTCVIVTNCAVYKIEISCSPVNKFIQCVMEENNLEKAEKISLLFGLNLQQLLECCGDLMISKGYFHSGIILYKQAKVHLLKRVLKLAISADCRTLLKFIHMCLSASKVGLSVATKIHIGNLAVMAYTELILRYGGQMRVSNTNDFMKFLCHEEHYDQVLAVNVACQAGHWPIVALLASARGLQPEAATALAQMLRSARAPRTNDRDFLYALSEPSLTQSLLLLTQTSQIIFSYIRANVELFPLEVLQRLAVQLDPSQPCAIPLVNRLFTSNKFSSSLDTTIESIDYDNPEKNVVIVKDFVETYLVVLIQLVAKLNDKTGFDLKLLDNIEKPERTNEELAINRLPDLKQLSCGFEHAAVVRNNVVYTMGVSKAGCLGFGPLLTQNSPPCPVTTLSDLKVKALSVSCGRKHTLCLTDHGVYSWGSNAYGQLGLGPFVQESPYPQMIQSLSMRTIVEISAGQYHSVALTAGGQVYTWGWGIHGQLGHGVGDNETAPRELKFKHKIKQVAAGYTHTLILTVDGKLYGFGSNIFGQLESCQIEANKSMRPIWVLLMPSFYTPIEKIATAYFHNIAATADHEVFIWGASPQEVRIFQSKNGQKQNDLPTNLPETWKDSIHIYSAVNKKPIEQVAVGYRHCAILHNGKILWGKSKDEDLCSPKLREQDNLNSIFMQKFTHVSCGMDYTMAIDHSGKVLAWGNPSMAQTILGKSAEDGKKGDGKVVFLKNTRRVIKFPNSSQVNSDTYPIEVPSLPSTITFNVTDHKLLFSKNFVPYAIRSIENDVSFKAREEIGSVKNEFDYISAVPNFKYGQKTLHYVLQTYYGLYDIENILVKCLEVENFQAASKIALLDGHFVDSLSFQIQAFKNHIETLDLNLHSLFTCKDSYDLKEKEQGIEIIIKNVQNDLNERNYGKTSSCSSPAHILSTSSSLDSIRQWGDDIEHQGGRESPCEVTEAGDIRQNISQYVQSLKNNESPPICSVSKMVTEIGNVQTKLKGTEQDLQIKDKTAKEVVEAASALVEFYIKKIYISENHILMQNVLLKCIEFWLSHNLPVVILENILLKNLDKYFYPLSILLFCKNFGSSDEELDKRDTSFLKPTSSGFLKEFSTKFCLQLCSMVLDNVNKA